MPDQRDSTVIAAVVAGIAAVLVAAITVLGPALAGDDEDGSPGTDRPVATVLPTTLPPTGPPTGPPTTVPPTGPAGTVPTTPVTAPVEFAFDPRATAPVCGDYAGSGTRPPDGQVVYLFVRAKGGGDFYSERSVRFLTGNRWKVEAVRIGDPADVGVVFTVFAVRVSAAQAAALDATHGRPNPLATIPGEELASIDLTRTAQGVNCG